MRQKQSPLLLALLVIPILLGIAFTGFYQTHQSNDSQQKALETPIKQSRTKTKKVSQRTNSVETDKTHTALKEDVSLNLADYSHLAVNVSTSQQTLSITSNGETIFETPVSTGAPESPTPIGDFVIEAERGDFFFNENSGEGAYYWVSFKDHGIYLFHSLPTDNQGQEITEEAALLGKPASHGCVRMKRNIAKWFFEQIPEGTPVSIR